MAQRDTDSAQAPGPLEGRHRARSAQPVVLEVARRKLPRRSQLRRSRQGLAAGRTGRHRSRRARADAPGAHVDRAAAPGLRRGRKAPRSRREGARYRAPEDRGPRRSCTNSRDRIQRRRARKDRKRRAVVGWPEARRQNQRHAEAGGLPRQAGPLTGGRRGSQDRQAAGRRSGPDRHFRQRRALAGVRRAEAARVVVEYFPKANARLATAGEVATIEFQ